MQISVYCVAVENYDSGKVNWYTSKQTAEVRYRELVNDPNRETDTVTRFNLAVDSEADPDRVTQLVENAMWEMDYTPLEQRVGIHGVSVKKTEGAKAAPFRGGVMAEKFMYMTRYWQQINDKSRNLSPDDRQHLIEVALPHQRAFNAVMMACFGDVAGVEFKAMDRDVWGVICPNVPTKESTEPWRIQSFDAHGMIGHLCYPQLIDAIEDLARQYPVADKGALDRVSATSLWSAGLKRQELRYHYEKGRNLVSAPC